MSNKNTESPLQKRENKKERLPRKSTIIYVGLNFFYARLNLVLVLFLLFGDIIIS